MLSQLWFWVGGWVWSWRFQHQTVRSFDENPCCRLVITTTVAGVSNYSYLSLIFHRTYSFACLCSYHQTSIFREPSIRHWPSVARDITSCLWIFERHTMENKDFTATDFLSFFHITIRKISITRSHGEDCCIIFYIFPWVAISKRNFLSCMRDILCIKYLDSGSWHSTLWGIYTLNIYRSQPLLI